MNTGSSARAEISTGSISFKTSSATTEKTVSRNSPCESENSKRADKTVKYEENPSNLENATKSSENTSKGNENAHPETISSNQKNLRQEQTNPPQKNKSPVLTSPKKVFTHEYKNEKNLIGEIFVHFTSINPYLYSYDRQKLSTLYQNALVQHHKTRLHSFKVTKRTVSFDLNNYAIYKQLRLNKIQANKKLALVCSRELKRAMQRTGKINPFLKGRRLPKLLLQKEKKNKVITKKKLDTIKEKQREQRKMEYLVNQTELFAHFVLKNDTKQMEQVRQNLCKDIENNPELDADQGVSQEIKNVSQETQNASLDLSQEPKNQSQDIVSDENKNLSQETSLAVPQTVEKLPDLSLFNGTLKCYQKRGVSWLISLYRNNINGILADDMGLGKTVQTISLLCYLTEFENKNIFLVVTPVSTLGNWESEIKRFAPIFDVNLYTGADRAIVLNKQKRLRKTLKSSEQQANSKLSTEIQPENQLDMENTLDSQPDLGSENLDLKPQHLGQSKPKPLIVLTSYNLLNDKKLKKIKFDYLICDEAQAIKSNKSLRWKNINTIQSKNRLLLTGTPIQNNLAELWSLLHFIMPSLFNDHNTFMSFFSNEKSVKKETLNRLHLILRPFMLRREKKDVKNELGKKIEKEIICKMTSYQKKIYDSVNTNKDENVIMQLRKIVNHPNLYLREEICSGINLEINRPVLEVDKFGFEKQNVETLKQFVDQIDGKEILKTELQKRAETLRNFGYKKKALVGSNSANYHPNGKNVFSQVISDDQPVILQKMSLNLSHTERVAQFRGLPRRSAQFVDTSGKIWKEEDIKKDMVLDIQEIKSNKKIKLNDDFRTEKDEFLSRFAKKDENDYLMNSFRLDTIPSVNVCDSFTERYSVPDIKSDKILHQKVKVPIFDLMDSGKFRVLHKMLSTMLDKRILVYFQMTKMMDLFSSYCTSMGYSHLRLDGQLKPSERKKIVDTFQNENIFIFMLSTRAGGLGLNLTKANTVIFYDSDWNPTVDQQAMDRAYRLGNKENVTVYRLITKDSVEEHMRNSAEMKEEIHRLVIDGGIYDNCG